MSKNTVKNLSLAQIASEEEKLKSQLAALAAARETQETARREKVAAQVRELPKMFGVGSLIDVINLVRQVEKGVIGKVDPSVGRTYVKLTDAQRAEIVEALKNNVQASVLVAKYGVSAPTIHSIKKDAGLVKAYGARETAPAATPAAAPAAVIATAALAAAS